MQNDSQNAEASNEVSSFGQALNNLVNTALHRGLSMNVIASILDQASFNMKFINIYSSLQGTEHGSEGTEGSTGEASSKIITPDS